MFFILNRSVQRDDNSELKQAIISNVCMYVRAFSCNYWFLCCHANVTFM